MNKLIVLFLWSLIFAAVPAWSQCGTMAVNPTTGLLDCTGSASGTVNTGTAGHLGYYATSTTALSDMGPDFTFNTHTLTAGASAVFDASAATGSNIKFPTGVLFGGYSFAVGTANVIPKWGTGGSGSILPSSALDDGATTPSTLTYTGSGGAAFTGGGIKSGSSPPVCAVGTASMLCLKGGSAGTAETSVLDLFLNGTQQASINENNTVAMTLTKGLTVNVTPATVNSSTTNDQNLMSFTVPANTLNVVGRTLKVFLAGVYSNVVTAQPTVTLKIKLCSVSGCGSGNVLTAISIASTATSATAVTNLAANLTGYVTVQTAGATSAYEAHGALTIDLGTTNLVADSIFADTNTATISSQTIDTTAQNFLQVAVAFSGASTSNSFTARQLVIEVVN